MRAPRTPAIENWMLVIASLLLTLSGCAGNISRNPQATTETTDAKIAVRQLSTIILPGNEAGMCGFGLTPDGSEILAVETSGNGIVAIDTTSSTVKYSISAGSKPCGAAVTRDGKNVFVSSRDRGRIMKFDLQARSIMASIGIGGASEPGILALTPDDRLAVAVAQGDGSSDASVVVINTTTNTFDRSIAVGRQPADVAITPDGAHAYIPNARSGYVSVVGIAVRAETARIPVGSGPSRVAISPDGRFAYVTTSESNVVKIDTQSNTVIEKIATGDKPTGIVVTPDGKYLVVISPLGNSLSVINATAGSVLQIIPMDSPGLVALSPDGRVAYVGGYSHGGYITKLSLFE